MRSSMNSRTSLSAVGNLVHLQNPIADSNKNGRGRVEERLIPTRPVPSHIASNLARIEAREASLYQPHLRAGDDGREDLRHTFLVFGRIARSAGAFARVVGRASPPCQAIQKIVICSQA